MFVSEIRKRRSKMKRTAGIMMMVFFFLSMAGGAYALDSGNPPIWKIFKSGKAVQWVDWKNNRRFAIYDSSTPNDSLDDMVLDKETGLVWMRAAAINKTTWKNGLSICNNMVPGNRKGWRLPTIQELGSLIDYSVLPPGPTLPSGHPFIDVQFGDDAYWSATVSVDNSLAAWGAFFNDGYVTYIHKEVPLWYWCVRGGQGADSQ
jgi:hypothetical protein